MALEPEGVLGSVTFSGDTYGNEKLLRPPQGRPIHSRFLRLYHSHLEALRYHPFGFPHAALRRCAARLRPAHARW